MTSRLCIVDTNVLVAGLITSRPSSPTAQVLDAMLDGRMLYVLSSALSREYRQVLLRPKLAHRHGLSESEVDRLLTELTANALWRELTAPQHALAPDTGDDHLWALLASEPGAALVTGDELLLDNSRANSAVVTASACAAILG